MAPYLMFPYMDGETAIRGQYLKVDLSPSEIFENLQFGIMGYFEARKGRWGTGIDAVYMALGSDIDTPPAKVDFNQGSYTFMGLRQLNNKVDLVFGLRWNVIQGEIGFRGEVLQGTFKGTKQWVDPLVGLKLKQPLSKRWFLGFEGDIGGFGAGSDFAWQLFPTVGMDLNEHASLGAGYRVLSLNFQTGSESERFAYNVVSSGIVIGMAFHF